MGALIHKGSGFAEFNAREERVEWLKNFPRGF
jgi:hypothetical protein